MKCTGLCYQGRSACTTPVACGLKPSKLNQSNSDGSSTGWHGTGSASAPMPLDFVGEEPPDDTSPYTAIGLWFFGGVAVVSLIITLALLAGVLSVRLGWV